MQHPLTSNKLFNLGSPADEPLEGVKEGEEHAGGEVLVHGVAEGEQPVPQQQQAVQAPLHGGNLLL